MILSILNIKRLKKTNRRYKHKGVEVLHPNIKINT